ncbi:NAD(P)/FAD-dependent oxidoreductase [Massilia sp. PAMC28688]|uniref:NAD(P)/FAD-dependent oxidoreductase n=1 Tax=Massilia sp. PAMC28688 TaxID=2861283 RepID=UPI001C624A50|nr:NAD(P)/FAD-dependent oxidoreductase [Massilia sp. PAMC28688]QYF94266.1 NAD(P)/FAD-dependent oxidoreductase [Massilia sp. PAMC28688]
MSIDPSHNAGNLAANSSFAGAIDTDAVIIGAGPVGLFQVFELGLLEIRAHVIDSLGAPGGQCMELYPDKPIYDIPALPLCTGQELTDNLLRQIAPFAPAFHLNQEVTLVQRREDGRFNVETSAGTRFIATTIFIAAGVGAFQPRTFKVEGIDAFEGSQLHYRVRDPAQFAGKHLLICGGGDSALDWAISLAGKAASVTLLHRRETFTAAPASVAKARALAEAGQLHLLTGQVSAFEADGGTLRAVTVSASDGSTRRVALDMIVALFGLSPRLGPIADWGLDLERRQVRVQSTEKFETNVPGIFAVGDINTYPGKKKLILCGFHEAALAAYGAAPYIFPGKKIHMQYTTTSPSLHKILGVDTPEPGQPD